ncbi:hypothetical protein AK812_SmicGene16068 [Symbiodinium microadriaticum]|uniref:Uncharacterized protein n=1 Tax=Symbiodinium microadriaticum TaxID=2951 RepID=A0A1Q9E1B3_SYMMI|nr:hypothetical protein AK812_SmicGene16068 [Symbiodinium microadriaticum]
MSFFFKDHSKVLFVLTISNYDPKNEYPSACDHPTEACGDSLILADKLQSPAFAESLRQFFDFIGRSGENIQRAIADLQKRGLIAAFNITFMLGGGITLKFYPLFYHREYGLSDVEICWIMAGFSWV